MYPIHAFGSEAQKERWLPALGDGDAVGCFGLTEPEHGSNPAGMETAAERDGDGYVLDGSKTWITNAPIADVAVVWARDRSHEDDPVRGFLVETDRDGVSTRSEKLSLRASITGEIGLNDVYVPEERASRRLRDEGAVVSHPGPLRHRVGCGRRGQRLLRDGACVRDRPRTVRRTDRPLPASTGKTGRDGDGDYARPTARIPPRRPQGTWRPPANTSRWPNETTSERLETRLEWPARYWAETGSRPTTPRCATWRTWRRSTRTRVPTISTR